MYVFVFAKSIERPHFGEPSAGSELCVRFDAFGKKRHALGEYMRASDVRFTYSPQIVEKPHHASMMPAKPL